MSRTFAYVRVSTTEQNSENQIKEIEDAGFKVEPHRIISETISGSMPTARRKGFIRLLDKIESKDILVVTKLDRLGRDAIEVINAVAEFERNLLIERTQSGITRAKSQGKTLGRPKVFLESQRQEVINQLEEGKTVAAIARNFNTSRQTIMRIRNIINN